MEISLYFHIPFCLRRCGYCDFNTFAGMKNYIPEYVKSLCLEVETLLSNTPQPLKIRSIYFGGGTPSLLTPDQFQKVFRTIRKHAEILNEAEITLEMNPETVTGNMMHGYWEQGFTRVSIGMQSASPFDLKVLDRQHKNESLLASISSCKAAGFTHINLDLIFGIPGQSLESWSRTLAQAVTLNADHFSVYSLILEEGTRLKHWSDRGLVPEPDDDLAADMYAMAMDELGREGYSQYEISNWAKSETARSKHNLQYWRFLPYLGFGAGAHGFWGNTRLVNTLTIPEYINRTKRAGEATYPAGPATIEVNRLSRWEMMQENLMVSLRMTEEGLSYSDFCNRYGLDMREVFQKQIERLAHDGLLEEVNGERIRLTRKGRFFGNRVFSAFIANKVAARYAYLEDQ